MAKEKKQEYYDGSNLLETGCPWLICFGQRANGKSYWWKKYCLEQAYNKGEKFIYLRRNDRDVKENFVTAYFDDAPVKQITRGTYDGVIAYHGFLYFYNFDEDNHINKGQEIGRYCSLNQDYRYKSQVFNDTTTILYEEMIPSNNMYLVDETNRLQQFASTIFRHRDGKVIMIGNTLSRVCPFFCDWSIDINRLEQGRIYQFTYNQEDDEQISVGVEYCGSITYKNKLFFGKAKEQILSGAWEVNNYNHLPKALEDFEQIYELEIEYMKFRFVCQLLADWKTGDRLVYIYPKTSDRKIDRVITDRYELNPMVSSRLNMKCKAEQYISECFRINKVAYSDNLTGTDFNNVNEHFKLAQIFV